MAGDKYKHFMNMPVYTDEPGGSGYTDCELQISKKYYYNTST